MRKLWRAFIKRFVVDYVPAERSACFDCDAENCANYETCPARLSYMKGATAKKD